MKVHAGLTYKREFVLADYSADDSYTVAARLINASGVTDDVDLSGDGTTWTLTIPKTTTAAYTAGIYTLQLIATLDAADYLVWTEAAEVVASGAADLRSDNRIILENLRTVIKTKSTKDHASLSIDGQSITRMSWDEIIKAEAHYARLVAAEQRNASGSTRIGNVQMRFS